MEVEQIEGLFSKEVLDIVLERLLGILFFAVVHVLHERALLHLETPKWLECS